MKAQGFIPVTKRALIGEHFYSTPYMPTADRRPDKPDTVIAKNFSKTILQQLKTFHHLNNIPTLYVKGNSPYKKNNPKPPATPNTINGLRIQNLPGRSYQAKRRD